MSAHYPISRAELAAVLTAGLDHSDPKDPNTSLGRMLTTICAITGIVLDDLLAAADLARATDPTGSDPLGNAEFHAFRRVALSEDWCGAENGTGLCTLPESAPVHQKPVIIQAPANATEGDLATAEIVAAAYAWVDAAADVPTLSPVGEHLRNAVYKHRELAP